MDITNANFDDMLPIILQSIKKSSFIAIDTEFTGNVTDDIYRRSLFDSGSLLYKKEMKNMEYVSINQLGLSIFKGIHDYNRYEIETYNFYVCPRRILSVDGNILMQVSSLEFFKDLKFNFNKWLYEGVPCLNKQQEKNLRDTYSGFLEDPLKRNSSQTYEVSDAVIDLRKWSKQTKENESMFIQTLTSPTEVLNFLLSIYHLNDSGIVASYDNDTLLATFRNIEENKRKQLMREECLKVVNKYIEQNKGIASVFDALVEARKPLIVHNGFLDLMLIYKQFHRPLPEKWIDFKADVHSLFPIVYDTKRIAQILSRKFQSSEGSSLGFLARNSLPRLTKMLLKHNIVNYAPSVQHASSTPNYNVDSLNKFHEAGYDACCTGIIFLQMSHICASLQCETTNEHRPLSAGEHIAACEKWKNSIPLQGGGIPFIRLDNDDTFLMEESWLVVQNRNPLRSITNANLNVLLAPFGKLGIVPRNHSSVLVSAVTYNRATHIITSFRNNKVINVARYNSIKHSFIVRNIAWTCALLSTGVSTWFVYKSWKKITSS